MMDGTTNAEPWAKLQNNQVTNGWVSSIATVHRPDKATDYPSLACDGWPKRSFIMHTLGNRTLMYWRISLHHLLVPSKIHWYTSGSWLLYYHHVTMDIIFISHPFLCFCTMVENALHVPMNFYAPLNAVSAQFGTNNDNNNVSFL